ncbi:protein Son-like isoform X2 [Tigriopus californicus]|uniref:protein Son-like isoform X2 n=1 Tax=Tigriopus californicus TaxID=6832 RepID=UPI0027DA474D|nr:protein Son-like isoform X2 [Tigriopus californicus]
MQLMGVKKVVAKQWLDNGLSVWRNSRTVLFAVCERKSSSSRTDRHARDDLERRNNGGETAIKSLRHPSHARYESKCREADRDHRLEYHRRSDHETQSRRHDSNRARDSRSSRERHRRHDLKRHQESRAPIRRDDDIFWDSTWDAMELQKKADQQERRGKHFWREDRERTPTLSPSLSPKRERLPSPDCEELRRLKKLKAIQEFAVKDDEKYVSVPPDSNDFEYDNMTKMWKRKIQEAPKIHCREKTYDEILKEGMEEQFQIKAEQIDPRDKDEVTLNKKIDRSKLTLDEIEEIRRKREKFKKEKEKKEKEEKEEGEIEDVAEGNVPPKRDRSRRTSPNRAHRSVSRRRSGSRHYERGRDRYERYPSKRDNFGQSRHYDGHNRNRYSIRSRSRSRERRRSRSRSRDRFRGSKAAIDKEKLLAIAKKNAVKLLSSDNLMGMDHGRLLAIKSGGQNLAQLTDFCRELARKGITDEFSDHEKLLPGQSDDEEVEYHHPFMVKDRPVPTPFSFGRAPGSSLAATGVAIEYLNPEAKVAAKSHRMLEFPVSSGNAHRVKETTTIEKEENPKEATPPPPTTAIIVPEPVEVTKESVETPQVETQAEIVNKSNPLGVLMFGGAKEPEPEVKAVEPRAQLAIEGPKPATTPEIEESASVFENVEEPNKDIGSIVSQRLDAMRKLSDNPQNPEALSELYNAQKQMSKWAESKNKPGQFTGHTGAQILSHAELSTGIQAWAKQDQFVKAKKVSGGFGEFMLKKMGWQEGEGLGKDKSGDVDPLTLDIKHDKRGLIAMEEEIFKKKSRGGGDVMTLTGCKDISAKHPVSGLMELATKRRWGPPNFVQAFEFGPSHKKQYIFKVTVNGVDYQPTIASDNKKKGKADAATVALQELGLLPKDPNNPL